MTTIAVFGAGIAGVSFVRAFEGAADIILVDPKDYFEVPYAQPRALMDPDGFGATTRKPLSDLLPVDHRMAKLSQLGTASATLDDGSELAFDFGVLATGSTVRGFEELKVADRRSIAERVAEWRSEHQRIEAAESIVVIGGGPIGVELAGEIAETYPDKSLTVVQAAATLLPALGAGSGRKAQAELEKRGVRIVLGQRAEVDEDGKTAILDSGETIESDIVYTATGIAVDTSYMRPELSGSVDGHGRIKVDDYLRVVGTETLFAAGDITDVPGIKLGAFAADQAKRIAENVGALLGGARLKAFKPMTRAVGVVTVGRSAGVAKLPIGTFHPLHRVKQKDLFVSRYLG